MIGIVLPPNPEDSCHLEFWNFSVILFFKIISLLFLCYLFVEFWFDLCSILLLCLYVPQLLSYALCFSALSLANCFTSVLQVSLSSVKSNRLICITIRFKSCPIYFYMSNLFFIFISKMASHLYSHFFLIYTFDFLFTLNRLHTNLTLWPWQLQYLNSFGLILFIVCADIYSYCLFLF